MILFWIGFDCLEKKKEIKIVAKALNLEAKVIEGEDLNKQGFGGIYNVGKAAKHSPKLVVLSNLKPEAKRTIAWVGKGIVYDTGGLCIKSRTGMCGMKVIIEANKRLFYNYQVNI